MSSSYAPCAACKYLRRKCTQECVFAPYFPPDNSQKFINVHKVFGASNISKILNELTPNQRNEAVNSLAYEAECRIKDPIYGCVGFVSVLQQHLRQVHQEIERAKKELATYIGPVAMQPILNNPGVPLYPQQNFDQMQQYQGQLVIQEPPQQQMAPMASREQEMLRAYLQQQQQEQFYLQQQQELYAQQQRMYLQQQQQQQQFNDAGDLGGGGFVQIPAGGGAVQPALALGGGVFLENPYQTQEHDHNSQQFQIQQLLMQGQQQQQQQQLMQYHEFAAAQPQSSQSQHQEQRDVIEEERSFSPL